MADSICQQLDTQIQQLKKDINAIKNGGGDPGELGKLERALTTTEQSYSQYQCNIRPWTPTSNSHGVLASSGNVTVFAAISQEGTFFYTWWQLGGGGVGWYRVLGAPLSDEPPSIALVGDQHNYLFVLVRERGTGILYSNQGHLGAPAFVGWNPAI